MKATPILRSALLGAAIAAMAIAPAMAIDQGFAPRPDFPGAKQSTSKSHTHHMRGKHHTSYRAGYRAAAAGAAVAPNYGYGYGSYWGPPPVGAPMVQNYNYGYGNYGYPGYLGPTTAQNAAAQDAWLAQNPARLRAIRGNFARER